MKIASSMAELEKMIMDEIYTAIVSVYAPAKRIRNMPITATINEL